jgi:lipopolysaccharide/colanic/teichoic acid biosynthesis glycosyltransferase
VTGSEKEMTARGDEERQPVLPGLPRPLDALLALLGLLAAAPLLVAAAIAILLTAGRPVLFRQERIGRGGRPFTLHKLRTMTPAGGPGFEPGVTARVTRVGHLLRRSKLDEVPQLWNVLRGDMSLVGPRPEVAAFVDLSDPLWRSVLATRPGVTDPVSLGLRDEESQLSRWGGDRESFYREILQPFKLRGYLAYLQRRTAGSDLKILAQTALVAAGVLDWPRVNLRDLGRPDPEDDGDHRN